MCGIFQPEKGAVKVKMKRVQLIWFACQVSSSLNLSWALLMTGGAASGHLYVTQGGWMRGRWVLEGRSIDFFVNSEFEKCVKSKVSACSFETSLCRAQGQDSTTPHISAYWLSHLKTKCLAEKNEHCRCHKDPSFVHGGSQWVRV